MSDFAVTFSRNDSHTRTNIIYDPLNTYRELGSNVLPKYIDWSTGGHYDATRAKFGTWSIRMPASISSRNVAFFRDYLGGLYYPTTPGVSHTMSAWLYADEEMEMDFTFDYYDAGLDYIDDSYPIPPWTVPGGVWSFWTWTHTPPANTAFVLPYVYKYYGFNYGFNVDGVVYERTPWQSYLPDGFIHPSFDGDYLPPYPRAGQTMSVDWDGTPGSSSSTLTYTSTEFTGDMLSLNITQGRQNVEDFSPPGRCELELLNQTTIPEIGCPVLVTYLGETLFSGTVADTEMIFSITDNTDILRVSCESYMAVAAQAEITLAGKSSQGADSAIGDACYAAGLYSASGGMGGFDIAFDDYQGNCLTHLHRIQSTTFGTIWDAAEQELQMVSGEYDFGSQIGDGFTDVLPSADGIVYSGIRFGSVADHNITFVRIEPDRTGVSPFEIGEPPQSLVLSTYSVSDADAEGLASTYLQSFALSGYSPQEITIDVAAQSNTRWAQNLDLFQGLGFAHRYQSLVFRGTTYRTVIQGFRLTATPDSARVTYFIEPIKAYPFLRLDDPDVGILDSNILGNRIFTTS